MLRPILSACMLYGLLASTLVSQEVSRNLSGTYVAEPVDSTNVPAPLVGLTFRLLEEGWSLSGDDGELVSGRYSVQADTLQIWDEGGRLACDSHLVGQYVLVLADNVLRLTLLEDQCPGRRMAMTAMKFVKRASRE